jgi:hypothetical protein
MFAKGPSNSSGPCEHCGCDITTHTLGGFADEKIGRPVSGYIICSVGGCPCWQEWAFDEDTIEALANHPEVAEKYRNAGTWRMSTI